MMLAPLATTCCCIAALAVGAQPRPLFRGTRHFVKNTTHSVVQLTPISRSSSSLTGWATTLMDNAAARLKRVGSPVQPDEFWEFIPEFVGSARPGTTPSALPLRPAPHSLARWCRNSSVRAADFPLSLTFETEPAPSVRDCADFFAVTTISHLHLVTVNKSGTHTVKWELLGASEPERADIKANGFRVFHFSESEPELLDSVLETMLLFLQPETSAAVTPAAAERNIKWLRDYAPGAMGKHFGEEREITDIVPPEADIADGDLFCILRLDGLDPLINWGTGGNCGHNTMALRIDGVLYVVESQSKGAYWDKDYVQRNTYPQWIAAAKRADYNVIHLPLSRASRAKFNASAAAHTFVAQYEGLLYGFPNMLWGWFDSGSRNFPFPLDVHLVTTLFAMVDPLLRDLMGTTPSLWNGAIAQRLGLVPSPNHTTAGLLAHARALSLNFSDLLSMPEQDSWSYPLPDGACGRAAGCSGPAQVCNVFVCKMWRAGGLFDADFNCGEQVPLDTYSMKLFSGEIAPSIADKCGVADPMNTEYCQILGKYRMALPHFNTIEPFARMRERCPSMAPNYPQRFLPAVEESC
jgi:hypothetical protein